MEALFFFHFFKPWKKEAIVRGVKIDRDFRFSERKTNSPAGEITPIDDIRSTQKYRLRVSLNLLEEFLR